MIMRKAIWFTFCLQMSVMMAAQTQQGYVKTKGRLANNGIVIAGTRLPGATVTVRGGNAVVSGNKGTFTIAFSGNNYYLQDVQKNGYVLTDPDVLSKQFAWSKNPLVLVLEIPTQQTDDKLAAERKIRRTLKRQLEEKEDEIESLKEQQKLSEDEYRKQLQELYNQQESNEKLISEMAERYSKMDFDEVDEFNRRISSLILDGKLLEADSLLNTKGDINSRTIALRQHQEANAQEEQEIGKRQKRLEKSKAMTQKELEDLAQDCYSKFEIFKMQHINDSAAFYIKLRADLDTTRLEWSLEAGKFYQKFLAQYQEAEILYSRNLNIALATDSVLNCQLLYCYEALASLYAEKGEIEKSLELYQKDYDMTATLFGTHHRDMVSSILNLANVYRKRGDYDKAFELADRAVELMNETENLSIGTKAKAYGTIANIYNSRNLHNRALDLYFKANALIDSCKTNFPIETITTYVNIGHTYHEIGNYDNALEWDNKALELIKNILGDYHPNMATILNNIGGIYLKQKNLEKALEYLKQAIQIDKKTYGQRSPNLIVDYNNLGMVQYTAEHFSDALDCYKESLYLCLKFLPENHPYFATIYNNIGSVYYKEKGKEELALDYFEKALQIRIQKYGDDNSDVALVYYNIAKIYEKKHEIEKAISYFEKAMLIFDKALGSNHPKTKATQEALNHIKNQQ